MTLSDSKKRHQGPFKRNVGACVNVNVSNNFLPPANEVYEGYVFTRTCHSVHRGGIPACTTGHMTRPPGQTPPLGRPPGQTPPPPNMVNEWAVRILLECILVVVMMMQMQMGAYPFSDLAFISQWTQRLTLTLILTQTQTLHAYKELPDVVSNVYHSFVFLFINFPNYGWYHTSSSRACSRSKNSATNQH